MSKKDKGTEKGSKKGRKLNKRRKKKTGEKNNMSSRHSQCVPNVTKYAT
jgi:hypothetical protein